ncbi:hypothetical protein ACNAUL_05890 [Raoultella ornithinolytica]|uniref:hypothetical protein n=1 Tax=Raoultella ornithinolytica TaxID=54291 RepID=UPI00376B620A
MMNKNLELFINKFIHKLFPEFSNKVTWLLITFGISILALPAPTYILFINLIIDFYNKTTKSNVMLIDIDKISPSSGIALTLILFGLGYHLIIKGFQTYLEIFKENNEKYQSDMFRAADTTLYNQFIELLPPDSLAIELLKDQDFGHSFHEESVDYFNKLNYKWGLANQHFHDDELEKKATQLCDEIKNFYYFLSSHSNYLNQGPLLSMLSDWDRAMDIQWAPETEENVKKANKWGTEIYNLYCDFIITCKKRLAV